MTDAQAGAQADVPTGAQADVPADVPADAQAHVPVGAPADVTADAPADAGAVPIGHASDPVTGAENLPLNPDTDCQSADFSPLAPTCRGDADLTTGVTPDPASAAVSAASQADTSTAAQSDRGAVGPVSGAPPLRDPDEAALRLAEAAVFASATPMTPRALSQILPDDLDPAAVIAALRVRYEGRGLEVCEIGGGLQFRTAADLAPQLRKVVQVPRRLPRVALETLAIVAYHQPITRPEIEDLRGTGLSQQTLDVLLENDLIVARGRKETPGRPTLWGTTAKFLEYFGLRDIRELPRRQDLLLEAMRPEAEEEAQPVTPEAAQS